MLNSISWDQFQGWMAYYEMEPFGEERGDYRMATLAALYVQSHTPKGKPVPKPADFMPKFGPPERVPVKSPQKTAPPSGVKRPVSDAVPVGKIGARKPIMDSDQWSSFSNMILSHTREERPERGRRRHDPNHLNLSARRRRELEKSGKLPSR